MKSSIKVKLVAYIVSVVIITGSFGLYFVYQSAKNTMINHTKSEIEIFTSQKIAQLEQRVGDLKSLVNTMSKNPMVTGEIEVPFNTKMVLEHYNVGNAFSAIYILDQNGIAIESTDERFIGKDYSFRPYFKESIKGNEYFYSAIGVTSGEAGYYFSTPIINVDGTSSKVLVAKATTEIIEETLGSTGDKESDHIRHLSIMLADNNGVILSSSDAERNLKTLGPISKEKEKEISESKKYNSEKIEDMEYGPIQNDLLSIENGETRTYEINHVEDDGEDEEVLVMGKIGGFPLYIVVETKTEEVVKEANKLAGLLGLSVGITAVASGLMIVFMVLKFTGPLKELKEFAEEIQKGNLKKRLNINTNDEVEEIADSLNKMAEKLDVSKEDMDKKIEERTKHLEDINKAFSEREIKMIELKNELAKLKENNED